jgi:beta-N-acetylhexosaminidase
VASLLAGADILCLGAVDQERAINSAAKAIFTALADGTLPAAVLIAAAKRRERLINSRRESYPRINVKRDEELVADAAERSLLVQGDVTLTGSQVDVLRLGASRGSAMGATPTCIGSHLLGFGLDINFIDTVVARSDRDLVIEVRDTWMSADLLRVLSDAVHARPDAVIVNVGMPNQVLPKCRGSITTHGIGNLSLSIAACKLTGRDPRPVVLSILEEAQVAIR